MTFPTIGLYLGIDPFRTSQESVTHVFYHLHQIRSVNRLLGTKAAATVMQIYMHERCLNGNAIYGGLTLSRISQLHSALNVATRLIGGISKFEHMLSFMREELHCLCKNY
jgi:hypothetical protein